MLHFLRFKLNNSEIFVLMLSWCWTYSNYSQFSTHDLSFHWNLYLRRDSNLMKWSQLSTYMKNPSIKLVASSLVQRILWFHTIFTRSKFLTKSRLIKAARLESFTSSEVEKRPKKESLVTYAMKILHAHKSITWLGFNECVNTVLIL